MVFAVAGERWSEEEFAEGDKDIFIARQLLLARRFRTKQPVPLRLCRTRVVPEQAVEIVEIVVIRTWEVGFSYWVLKKQFLKI